MTLKRFDSRLRNYLLVACATCFTFKMNLFKLSVKYWIPKIRSVRYLSSNSGQTIVKDEVSKFNEQADHWWDTEGPVKPLHCLNNMRVPFIREGILNNKSQPISGLPTENVNGPHPLQGYKLIDVGCGAGILSEALAKIGADVTGLDAGDQLIEIARRHSSQNKAISERIRYVNKTIEEFAGENASTYDAVVCSEVIEHVNNPSFFVEQCIKLVKPGGSVVFTTIGQTFLGWFFAIFMAETVLGVIGKGTHHYEMLITAADLEKMLKSNNCDVRKSEGYLILPNGHWARFPSNSVFYAMHAVKNV